ATPPPWDRDAAAGLAAVPGTDGPRLDHARLLLTRVHDDARRIGHLIDSLYAETEPAHDVLLEDETEGPPPLRERLGALLDLESAVLRHVLRVAMCVAIAASLATVLDLRHGHWITITAYILLLPNRAATTTRAIQRGVGTVTGAMIAAAIAFVVRDPVILMVIIVVLAGIGASVLQLNYGLYSLFVTPTFVLLAEVHTGDFTLVEVRVLYTLIGGGLAFLASALLWPAREHVAFGDQMAEAVSRAARYLGSVRGAITDDIPSPSPAVIATRRAFGLALNNAESALDRVIAERTPDALLEPRMTMVMTVRRLGGAINVLGSTRAVVPYAPHARDLAVLAEAIEQRLAELASTIRDGTPPPPPPPATAVPFEQPTIAARLSRIDAQLAVLTDAVTRAATRTRNAHARGAVFAP
ncbi:MAG: FUSC family protein, partial [Myxococcota bacterium]|nr:FUSC family protein [Myxococcota bacterium]